MTFSLTAEQMGKLKEWKLTLRNDWNKEWDSRVKEASATYNKILLDSGFDRGSDLSESQLNELCHLMRILSRNRALGSNLYTKKNSLSEFNKRLRILLFRKEPIAKRINQFVELNGVQEQTMSHFLCLKSLVEFPYFSWPTYEILEIDATQEEEARKQALTEHSISAESDYYDITLAYLLHWIILREVKEQLELENFPQVNVTLWDAQNEEGETEPSHEESITSISIEKDLSDHIAKNPTLIEKDLTLVGREFQTDVGRIDVLFKDKSGKFLVVETKKGRESDKVVGQILRYIGWVRKNKGECRGMIIVGEEDERLNYSVSALDFVRLKKYEVKFEFNDIAVT